MEATERRIYADKIIKIINVLNKLNSEINNIIDNIDNDNKFAKSKNRIDEIFNMLIGDKNETKYYAINYSKEDLEAHDINVVGYLVDNPYDDDKWIFPVIKSKDLSAVGAKLKHCFELHPVDSYSGWYWNAYPAPNNITVTGIDNLFLFDDER